MKTFIRKHNPELFDALYWVALAVLKEKKDPASDSRREAFKYIYLEKHTAIATDGIRLHQAHELNTGLTHEEEGLWGITKKTRGAITIEKAPECLTAPDYAVVTPEYPNATPYAFWREPVSLEDFGMMYTQMVRACKEYPLAMELTRFKDAAQGMEHFYVGERGKPVKFTGPNRTSVLMPLNISSDFDY